MVVSNIFYFHPYSWKISNLIHIFQMGWNHQLDLFLMVFTLKIWGFSDFLWRFVSLPEGKLFFFLREETRIAIVLRNRHLFCGWLFNETLHNTIYIYIHFFFWITYYACIETLYRMLAVIRYMWYLWYWWCWYRYYYWYSRLWFHIFFIFIPTWVNDSIWLTFFKWGWFNHQLVLVLLWINDFYSPEV